MSDLLAFLVLAVTIVGPPLVLAAVALSVLMRGRRVTRTLDSCPVCFRSRRQVASTGGCLRARCKGWE